MGRALEQGAQAVVPDMTELEVTYCSLDGNAFTYRGEAYELPLPGMHQATNAVTVLETVEVLRGRGFALPYEAVARGLDNTRFAGRFELVGENPLRMVDGGITPTACRPCARRGAAAAPRNRARLSFLE